MRAVGRVDQLRRHAHARAAASHAAFEYVVYSQNVADLANVLVFAFKGEGGGSGDHFQAGNLRQNIGDLFGKAVGEIFILRVAADVVEGQHDDGGMHFGFGRLGALRSRRDGGGGHGAPGGYRRDKAVTQTWNGFDVAGRADIVAQRGAQLPHTPIDAHFKIHRSSVVPQRFTNGFASY